MLLSLLALLDAQIVEMEPSSWASLTSHDINVLIESFTLFAVVWSLGANCVKVRSPARLSFCSHLPPAPLPLAPARPRPRAVCSKLPLVSVK